MPSRRHLATMETGVYGTNLMDADDMEHYLVDDTGLDADPLVAYARSGCGERIVAERVGGQPAGWDA